VEACKKYNGTGRDGLPVKTNRCVIFDVCTEFPSESIATKACTQIHDIDLITCAQFGENLLNNNLFTVAKKYLLKQW